MYDINRFIEAQERDYELALSEIKSGYKVSHWMWYIFPQLKGLGESYTSEYYGINGIEEAKVYINNDYLRNNLLEISHAVLVLDDDIANIFGYPDCLKLKSCMTLFNEVLDDPVFIDILNKFYNGEKDNATLQKIKR